MDPHVPAERTVFRRHELVAAFDAAHVRRELAARRWQRPARGVVVTHNGPLSADESVLVALSAGPPGAALAGLTSLAHDGLTGFGPSSTAIVLPEGARRPSFAATYHYSTELSELDVHPARSPRRTRPARSLVDAAAWSRSERFSRVLIIAGAQQGLASPAQLRDALSRRGPCRHRALISESILDVVGGVQSLPERDFTTICLAIGIPRPKRQSRVGGLGGSPAYLDVCWPEFGLAAEVHGIPHHSIVRWDDDLDRANHVVARGPRLMVFSSFAVRHRPERVAVPLHAAFRRAGWVGPDLPTNLREHLHHHGLRLPHAG